MTAESRSAKTRLYAIAIAGLVLQAVGIYLMAVREVSVAIVLPLLMIGMFMAFAPAIARKRESGP